MKMVSGEVSKTKDTILSIVGEIGDQGNEGNNEITNDVYYELPPPPDFVQEQIQEEPGKTNFEQAEWVDPNSNYYASAHTEGVQDTYEDVEYFSSYSKMSIHHEMVFDKRRTAVYFHAISKSKDFFKDKVVLDVGCGTGILSCFCAKAGAKRVYAVDASDMAYNAELVVERNGLGDIVKVMKGKLEHIAFPEYVDIIVSEWIGSFLIFESMLESVIYARDHLLKPGGVLFPSKAALYFGPVNVESYYEKHINQWENVFGLDMSCLVPMAREELLENKTIRNYYIENSTAVLDKPITLRVLDLNKITIKDLSKTVSNFDFKIPNGKFHGFAAWFSIWFENLDNNLADRPSTLEKDDFIYYVINKEGELVAKDYKHDQMDKGLTPKFFELKSNTLELSTAPGDGDTHWKQVLFLHPVEKHINNQDEKTSISGTIRVCQNYHYRRHWFVELSVSCKTKPTHHYYEKYLI
ncbi:hypothetical protein DICPUDRAFT_157251 [Dictyostelium purpureum]|uniref:type I protein arginine methyltransferase n=1 Tax=Dictyostelium purpureum TaxID=5786 RepID=F0ZYN2_DICPU|nr:uncharacterized protein DICPUDRAFT_157251 [Dictyostelium purpureum]EGC30952.1 hypothetical protein DICPUDRAFT_157251 [Dictyostelium purpureum]|eukprot:XP_003292529.1 hypothetical protein DICPUDRAFT_157251 [Dictyostelium purpureum]